MLIYNIMMKTYSKNFMKIKRKTASIIIIGNEILSGKTLDTNSNYIAKKLRLKGIKCNSISVVPDDEKTIIQKVNEFRKSSDYIFTTGGIGPTHDDITSKSISKSFKITIRNSAKAWKRLEKHYLAKNLRKLDKMAYMPKGMELIDNPVSIAPGFIIENIYVFPGVPKILEVMIDEFFKKIDNEVLFIKTISTILSEGIIGSYLEDIQKNKDLEIGSYPYFKKIHLVYL